MSLLWQIEAGGGKKWRRDETPQAADTVINGKMNSKWCVGEWLDVDRWIDWESDWWMHRLVASVEGGLCVTLKHLAVSYFRFIFPEMNLLFFEMNTTDVGYFIAISSSVKMSFLVIKMFRNQDKALHWCRIDTNNCSKGSVRFILFLISKNAENIKIDSNTF